MVPDERSTVIDPSEIESEDNVMDTRKARNEAAIRLIDSWSQDDDGEQKETWEYLKKALDEDRLSSRPLFP